MLRNVGIAVLLTALCNIAIAAPGVWFEPARDGHGLTISQPTEAGSAVIWYLYTRDGAATFVIGEPCAEFPCITPLYQPSAGWLGGGFDLGDPIGSLELQPAGDELKAVYDLRGLSPDLCNTGPGGLLFRECVGRLTFIRLAE